MIVATAGHVDHGKTRLVHALTGIETDRLEEEKTRGLTIDLGFAYTDFGSHRVGFIDVPGHIRFIANMLSGVSIIDAALLTVAADDGPMPQTREHLAILDLLGVSRGWIVITKTDLVDPARVAEVRREVTELVHETSLASAPVLATSGETGAGIRQLKQLIEASAARIESRSGDGIFRLAIDRAFTLKGAGLVVTGSVFDGQINTGDALWLSPDNHPAHIRSIHRQNVTADTGHAGDRLALNLRGPVQANEISRGHWVTSRKTETTRRIDVQLRILEGSAPVRHWMPVHFHTAASHVTARVAMLDRKVIKPGESGLVQLILARPLNVWRHDRFILRTQAADATIGGGQVIDPFAPQRGRNHQQRLDQLHHLQGKSLRDRIENLLNHSSSGFYWAEFVQSETSQEDIVAALLADCGGHIIGNTAIHASQLDAIKQEVVGFIHRWQAEHPIESGAHVADIHKGLNRKLSPDFLNHLLRRFSREQLIEHQGGKYQPAGRRAMMDPSLADLWREVERLLQETPSNPPSLHDIASKLQRPVATVARLLDHCRYHGLLIQVSPRHFFLPNAIENLFTLVRETVDANGGEISVRQFRDASGLGRNLCIEILEYFDRDGRTVRQGDSRKLRQVQVNA